jgi:hypothetical protein
VRLWDLAMIVDPFEKAQKKAGHYGPAELIREA